MGKAVSMVSLAINRRMPRIISRVGIQHLNTQNTYTGWKRHEAGSCFGEKPREGCSVPTPRSDPATRRVPGSCAPTGTGQRPGWGQRTLGVTAYGHFPALSLPEPGRWGGGAMVPTSR